MAFSGLPLSAPSLVLVEAAFFPLAGSAVYTLVFLTAAGLEAFTFVALLDVPLAVVASASGTELSPLDTELRSLSVFRLELMVRTSLYGHRKDASSDADDVADQSMRSSTHLGCVSIALELTSRVFIWLKCDAPRSAARRRTAHEPGLG